MIYAGSNTGDHTTANWKMPRPGTAIIQIDLDPVEIGRNYAGVIGIQADVRTTLEALAAASPAAKHDEWLAQSKKHVDEWRAEAEKGRTSDEMPMRPERLAKEVNDVLPKDAILVADTGYAALWSGTLIYLQHATQRYIRAAGSLGWSFPASLGAKCAAPDRPVICFCGDGGFYYHLPELETARRRGINLVVVLNNNGGLAQGQRTINAAYGNRAGRKEELYAFGKFSFETFAQQFDCFGATVDKASDFAKTFKAALASNKPAVIDVRTEFTAIAPDPWLPE